MPVPQRNVRAVHERPGRRGLLPAVPALVTQRSRWSRTAFLLSQSGQTKSLPFTWTASPECLITACQRRCYMNKSTIIMAGWLSPRYRHICP